MAITLQEGQHIVDYVVSRVMGGVSIGEAYGVGTCKDGIILGGIVYHLWNGPNVFMHCASDSKNWITKSYISHVFNYAFNVLNVKRITGMVDSTNVTACKFNEHVGFKKEAVLKNASPSGDLIMYVMNKEECKWAFPHKLYPNNK